MRVEPVHKLTATATAIRQAIGANTTNRPTVASPVETSVRLLRGDAVAMEPVHWLWKWFLPAGMLTILGGAPGAGKSTIALSFAATVTRGGTWPDGWQSCDPGDVIVWSGEDPPSVCKARLVAAGADLQRMHFIDGVSDGKAFDPARDMPLLEATLMKLPAPRLLILDPIVSAVAGDSHKAGEVRRALQPVVDLAHRLGCGVLGITHFSKGTAGRDPVERVTGSIAFAALARMVLVAAKKQPGPGEEGEPQRILMRAKSNISLDDGGFAYSIEQVEVAADIQGQRVRWLGALKGSARELLADAEAEAGGGDGNEDAGGFLLGLLADGPVGAKTILSEASGAGYSRDQIQRAARRLGVERRKEGMHGGWLWALRAPEGGSEGSEDRRLHGVPPSPSSAPSSARPDRGVDDGREMNDEPITDVEVF